ncbi:hypothetical protein P3840_08155 [Pseudomonas aeruginosa]|nr:type ISP restriction/modification enzyme [Pseudomonas aeruginosa]MDP5952930.1 hypothetical protein [Pseudomonas aeruginosa]MDP5961049.1 hypothetical protein [Pseudomonas aeruginosa]
MEFLPKIADVHNRKSLIYNNRITLKAIPEAAWNYVVNGKAALD